MGGFRKISDKISVDDSGINEVFLVNGQWQFTLPDGLSYEIDGEFTYIKGGIDLSGSTKPLVLKEGWSVYDQSFCAAVEPHYSFTGDHTTIIDCKYDNRFGPDNGMNSQRVIIDEPGFYVDLVSVNTWPFGVEAQIRVRGDDIDPYNITMMVKPEGDAHWQHIADYFREIANSICVAARTAKKAKNTAKKKATIDDPNCIMSGTVLQRYVGWDADVVLPEGMTELADNIFSGRDGLRSIVIPEGVTAIGSRAFENCFNLESVTLPESLRSIGEYAFVDCHELKHINLESNLEEIGGSAFSECFKLENVNIPTGIKTIDAFAFKNCWEFTEIIIPDGVTSIGFTAFAACTNLEYLYIPASVTGIYDNFMGQTPFDGCNNLTIYCPVGSYAAEYATSHAIRYEIVSSQKTTKKTNARKGHENGSTEKTAQTHARKNTTGKKTTNTYETENGTLKKYKGTDSEVVIPEEISHIAHGAFRGNELLQHVTIGRQVVTIAVDAFTDCTNLETVEILGDVTKISFAFSNCIRLRRVKLPASLRNLGHSCFSGCKNLQSLELPEGLEVLDLSAFNECSELHELVIPSTVRRIDWNKVYNKMHLACQVYAGSPAERLLHLHLQDADFAKVFTVEVLHAQPPRAFVQTKQETETFQIEGKKLVAYIGQAEQVTIPAEVTEIGRSAFEGNLDIRRVILHNKVTKIEDSAFSGCRFLEEINLPDSLRSIGEWSFGRCDGLKTLCIPAKVKVLKKWSFSHCAGLTTLIFSNGLTKISCGAFADCTNLMQVDLPDTLQTIESSAFANTGIENLILPKGLTEIENFVLTNMPCLRSVVIPRALENLEACKAYGVNHLLFHVYPDSAAERCCKEEGLQFDHNVPMTSEELERMEKIEAERKRKKQEAEEAEKKLQAELVAKRIRYDEISDAINLAKQIIAQNKGWFGAQAKARKAAQEQLAALQAQLAREFPNGRP